MNYYNEIKNELINNEVYKKVKDYSKNRSDLMTYYNIGKLIIEVQGGEERAKYDNKLIKEYSERLTKELGNGYSTTRGLIRQWKIKYLKEGIEGLISKTGTVSAHHKNMGISLRKPKNKIEELELEIMRKDIEIARLKKGYLVKGVGQEKEYITTFDKNTK